MEDAENVENAGAMASQTQVAVVRFKVTGPETAASLKLKLRDGLLLGFLNEAFPAMGLELVDKRLKDHAELRDCQDAPCLTALGGHLSVPYVAWIDVEQTGNNYKMTGRLYSTQGVFDNRPTRRERLSVLQCVPLKRLTTRCSVWEKRFHRRAVNNSIPFEHLPRKPQPIVRLFLSSSFPLA